MSVDVVNLDRWAITTARSSRSTRRVTTVERRRGVARWAAPSLVDPASAAVVAPDVVPGGNHRRDWRWPNALVPYVIDPDVVDRRRVMEAIARWEDLVEVRFVDRTSVGAERFPSWLRFRPGVGSITAVGMQGGEQVITLDPRTTADAVVRLIGHALGVAPRSAGSRRGWLNGDDHGDGDTQYVAAARRRYPFVKQIPGSFGVATRAADIAVADLARCGAQDLIVFHVDGGENPGGFLRVGRHLNRFGTVTRGWSAPVAVPGPWSSSVTGGGVAVGDLNGDGTVDVVIWSTEPDAVGLTDGAARGWLRVGRALNCDGLATGGWSSPVVVPGGQGRGCRGGGMTLFDLSGSGHLDVVLLQVASDELGSSLSYRVGHDLAPSGQAAGWSAAMPVPPWSARACQGTGIAVATFYGDGYGGCGGYGDCGAGLVIGHVGDAMADHQASHRTGRSLTADGAVSAGWTAAEDVGGWFGWESTHAGIAAADLTGKGRVDLIVFHVDNPIGESSGFYRLAGG